MKIDFPKFDFPKLDLTKTTDLLTNMPEIQPLPVIPNQEKQIDLMTKMVNKQSEMINKQTEMIKKQNELISLIRNEAIESSKQSKLALFLSILGLISGLIQIIPTIILWIEKLLQLL